MNAFALSCLFTFIFAIALGIFVYWHGRKKIINKLWGLFSIAISLWTLGLFGCVIAQSKEQALNWQRVLYIGTINFPFLFFHYVCALLDCRKQKRKIIISGYLIGFFFLAISFTKYFIAGIEPRANFNYWPIKPGILYYPFLLIFFVFIVYSHFLLYKEYKISDSMRRNRIKYILLAGLVGFGGGSTNFLLDFNTSIYPFGNFFVVLYAIIMAYAILRYRLMDIEVIIRETAVFAGIFGFAVGIFVFVMFIAQKFLEPFIGTHQVIFPAAALFLVAIAVRPIERLTYATIGKLLFKKRQKYQQTLKDAAEGMATIRKPERLLGLIAHIVSKTLKPVNVAIYIFDDITGNYRLKSSRFPSGVAQWTEFQDREPLITLLKETKKPVALEEISHLLKEEKSNPHEQVLTSDLVKIKSALVSLKANICVPSFYEEDELLGILILGDKKSGDLYTHDDLELLSTLANEAAIAIRNAILYGKLEQKAREIERIYEKEQVMFSHAAVAFANAIDARDPYTHGHSERVTKFSLALADQMELVMFGNEQKQKYFKQRLNLAALLHDIGKIAIPDRILQKQGPLNDEEWKKMREHPVIGAKVLDFVRGLWDIVPAVRHHHERYDGTGYPDKLREENIPFMARIMAVADTFDAMTSNRPYRKALDENIATREINDNSAKQFDPYVVGAFMKAYTKGLIGEIVRESQ
ncbi:MAG: HD domain-containing protein [Candidatus Omnitrophica bacterium]|nr:HD domain-containing protein [Candidatus Omnitrophota bacterium]